MMPVHPIEIIGGGLAGLSLGVALRRHGVPVTVHEAAEYPRHRVCGEFITGLSPHTIATLGLEPVLAGALEHREVAWFLRDQRPSRQKLPAPALALSRHTLDARLAARLVELGGELCTRSRFATLADAPGRVFATGRRRTMDSPWIGLKVHATRVPLAAGLEVHLGDDCYVGLTPVDRETVNVCGLFRRRPLRQRGPNLLLSYLSAAALTTLAERLRAAVILPEAFCAVAAVEFADRVSHDVEIRVGDAAGMIPPFTGNGMAMAFQSAEAALEPLVAFARGRADWAETRAVTNAALRGRFRVRLASARALHPFLLHPLRQRWLLALSRARLLPFRPLYATLH